MKTEELKNLHPTLRNLVKSLNVEDYITEIDKMTEKIPNAMSLAERIVGITKLSARMKKGFLYGYDRTIKSNGEYYGEGRGIRSMYDGYQINSAIRFADRYLKGETRVEVGMKKPEFNLTKFKKLFSVGEAVKMLSYVSPITGDGYFYDVFSDDKGNVFTFEPNSISKGGYAGAVFVNEAEALKFLDFLLGDEKHYVKDLDIGLNSLGGWNIAQVDEKLKGVTNDR